MTDYVSVVLDELVPSFEDERGDWGRVLHDARLNEGEAALPRRAETAIAIERGELSRGRPMSWLNPRRLVIIAAIVAAIAIPLAALAASQNWWFFRFSGGAPTPITGVTVVRSGSWDGQGWQLTAYRSGTDGICFSMTPTATAHSTGEGAAMNCDQIAGVPRTAQSKQYTPHAITFLSGSFVRFPAYVVGPVIATADEVVIHLADGTTLRTATFDAPEELGSAIRFYATRLPAPLQPRGLPPRLGIRKLVGLAHDGRIVACLVVPMPEQGVPLSACQ
jgi:hypothetical protein